MQHKSFMVAVSGGSGSGKSTFVEHVRRSLPESLILVLGQDHYYRDLSHLAPADREKRNFDHPGAIDKELLVHHLKQLGAGESIMRPTYDFKSHTRSGEVKIDSRPVTILDGIFAFTFEQGSVFDLKLFIDVDEDIRLVRRLHRDTNERGRSVESVTKQYLDSVKPMFIEHVQPTRDSADFVVPWNNFNTRAVERVVNMIRGAVSSTQTAN